MNKILITGCAVATAFAAVAMPTKKELTEAQKPVEEATKADLTALKAGQKTAKEVAESHLALAAKAENQAEKYLYYQGAFKLYARSGEYSQAIDTLQTLKRDVKDVTPEVINELVGQELRGVARDKAEKTVASHGKTKEGPVSVGKETVGAYTWSYRVTNGEATIALEKGGEYSLAVSPSPKGSIAIPSTLAGMKVSAIGKHAFMGSALDSVKIPEGVTTIGHGAFAWIGGLKSVEIPSSVTNIGGVAFISSSEMESFHVAADNPAYSSRNGMLCTKDGSTLLAGINGEIVIPDGVTGIGGNAFHRCGRLKSVTVSASVTNIHSQAFFGCGGLTSVTMLGERPKAADNAFERCDKLKAIHVSAKAKSWAGMKEWQGIPLVFDAK